MRAKLDSMPEQYRVGDRVQHLVATYPKGPRAGSVGVVVCGDELGEPRSTLAVTFASGATGEPGAALAIFRRHLRRLQAAPGDRGGVCRAGGSRRRARGPRPIGRRRAAGVPFPGPRRPSRHQ